MNLLSFYVFEYLYSILFLVIQIFLFYIFRFNFMILVIFWKLKVFEVSFFYWM